MLVIKGLFTQCDNICDNVKFLLMQVMGSTATNGSVRTVQVRIQNLVKGGPYF